MSMKAAVATATFISVTIAADAFAGGIQQAGASAVYPAWYKDQRVECIGANEGVRLVGDIEWPGQDPRENSGMIPYPLPAQNDKTQIYLIGSFNPGTVQTHLPYLGPHDDLIVSVPGEIGYNPILQEYLALPGPNAIPGVNVGISISFLDFRLIGGPLIPQLPLVFAADVGNGMELLTHHERLYRAIELGLVYPFADGFILTCPAVNIAVGGPGTGDDSQR